MFTVYIADDEAEVRQGLKKIIDWNAIGFEICGEANNGLTAYNEIIKLKPDMLLVDIRMPKMNGLDLAGKLREEGYDFKIIILSGYSEFKYAQEAISYDVDSYLTKPIEEDELETAVINIRKVIEKKLLQSEHLNYYQKKAKHKILEEIIKFKGESLDEVEHSLSVLNLNANQYQVIIIQRLDQSFNAYEDLCKHLKVSNNAHLIERLEEDFIEVVLLIGELVIERFKNFKENHELDNNKQYFIAAGSIVTIIQDIYSSYEEAFTINERRFFLIDNMFIAYKTDLSKNMSLVDNISKSSKLIGKEIYDLIITFKQKECKEKLVNIKNQLTNSNKKEEEVKNYLAGIYIYIIQEFMVDYASYKMRFLTNTEIIQWISDQLYLHYIIEFIYNESERMIRQIGGFNSDSIVDEIIEFIKYHYREDIKLKTLAPKFGYNSSYLGKLFSEKLDISFNDYLHQVRIEKAKELLLNDKYKVYEISELVGYKNVDYFHLKFRHFSGCTPNVYRANINNKT